jgi:hypothetical protein
MRVAICFKREPLYSAQSTMPVQKRAKKESNVTPKSWFSPNFVPTVVLCFVLLAITVVAQTTSVSFIFLVASGFLCGETQGSSCRAIARSVNGDSFELSGAGSFRVQDKSVNASGVFSRKSADGTLLETGIWAAKDLISFESYGAAPAALLPFGPAVGSPHIGPRHLGSQPSRLPVGGVASLHIVLMPVSGDTKIVTVQLNSALGVVPRERATEGIRIELDTGLEYLEEAGSRVMFLTSTSGARVPTKSSQTP